MYIFFISGNEFLDPDPTPKKNRIKKNIGTGIEMSVTLSTCFF